MVVLFPWNPEKDLHRWFRMTKSLMPEQNLHTPLQEIIEKLVSSTGSGTGLFLDLAELDFEEGAAVALLVDQIKQYLKRDGRLDLFQAPQVLAHNLYRVGLLTHPRLTLTQTRMDEAHAG
ncbi:MAG: hypothetical protein DYH02_08580 [Candidatus Omnitrophica bacterium COP1]|nr:hypothetical protein [Candidatus Omnitrophica bacterium COP1]